jgi:uncharacterized protein (DUF58 family)
MVKRWLRYLAVWISCLIFYFAYRQWMAWIILMSVSLLPLLSLALSLPAMLLSRVTMSLPETVAIGTQVPLDIRLECPLPPPQWSGKITAHHSLMDKLWSLQPELDCPTEHCGLLQFSIRRCRVYDYMGLFFLPKRGPGDFRMHIRPTAQRPKDLPDPDKQIFTYWKPKAGGGFSEHHELRLYRPGDSLRQIHWKLSGKTGNLIYREPMMPMNNRLLLQLTHGGTPQQLDRKLSSLLWLGLHFSRRELRYDILAHTGSGPITWHIDSRQALFEALDALLEISPLAQADIGKTAGGLGHFYIGGDADEA